MAGESYIITPIGSLVNMVGGHSPILNGRTVTHGDVVETFNDAGSAQSYYRVLIQAMIDASVAVDTRPVDSSAPTITSISPSSVAQSTGIQTITIIGTNFTNVGTEMVWLWSFDTGTLTFVPTYISPTSVTFDLQTDTAAIDTYNVLYSTPNGNANENTLLTVT